MSSSPTHNDTIETAKPTRYTFVYKDMEYDASDYLEKHPGGSEFIRNMKTERDDLTEYFR
jgi:cytochrome b involved in lipid metabolism